MSRSIGTRLPDRLLAELAAEPSDKVLVAATIDEGGWPHPALLAVEAVEPAGERVLRVTLMASSRAAANLTANSKLTLALVDPDMVYYVKATASRNATVVRDGMIVFEAIIDDVLEDTPAAHEAGSAIRTGITFRRGGLQGKR